MKMKKKKRKSQAGKGGNILEAEIYRDGRTNKHIGEQSKSGFKSGRSFKMLAFSC